ncbi:MAG: PqqD family protein [Aphanothece sp. CMT-3BRIN-NPC111]|jgi:hypothetical protein|nr:PqqD family protein [Aphanothece sp. CMT-3BRIN-NPC111]
MNINANSQLALSDEVLFQDLAGEAAVLHLKTEEYFTLNETGTLAVNLLSECESVREMCDRFLEEYEIEPTQLEQDLLNYLDELVSKDIVIVKNSEV